MQRDREIHTLKLERLEATVWMLTVQVTCVGTKGLRPSTADSRVVYLALHGSHPPGCQDSIQVAVPLS